MELLNFLFWCWIDTRFVGLYFLRLSRMVQFVRIPRLIMVDWSWFDSETDELSESSLAFCMVTGSEVVPTIFFFDFLAFFFLFCLLFKVVLLAAFSFFAARTGSALACNLVRALRVGFGLGFSLRIILLIMFNGVITGASGGLCGHCGIKWVMPQSLHIALGRCWLGTRGTLYLLCTGNLLLYEAHHN